MMAMAAATAPLLKATLASLPLQTLPFSGVLPTTDLQQQRRRAEEKEARAEMEMKMRLLMQFLLHTLSQAGRQCL